jgi:MoaA/NifB/PqqE/SkfB family radical SAM enzyme
MSSGILLEANAANIVRWCDAVTVSVDGSRHLHGTIRRVPDALDRLARGVSAIKVLRPEFPIIGRSVIHRSNYRELPYIIHVASALGLDGISFLPADVTSEGFNRQTPWDEAKAAEVTLTHEEVADFSQLVENVIEIYHQEIASGFLIEKPDALRRLPRYFAALNGGGAFPKVVCNAPWISCVIEADQTVRPCYFRPPIGNVRRQSLSDVLNGREASALRRSLSVPDDPVCQRCVCPLYLPNTTLGLRFGEKNQLLEALSQTERKEV